MKSMTEKTNQSTLRSRRFRQRFRRIELNLNPEFALAWDALGERENLNHSGIAELLLMRFAAQRTDGK